MIRTATTDALADWVGGVTGRIPVFDNLAAMGPRESAPFASMVLTSKSVGRQYTIITEIAGAPAIPNFDLTETACLSTTMFISMNLVMGDPFGDMELLRASVGLSTWTDTLRQAGLGFSELSESRDLTEVVKEDYESRVQADWTFLATIQASADIYSIEQITINNADRGTSFLVGA